MIRSFLLITAVASALTLSMRAFAKGEAPPDLGNGSQFLWQTEAKHIELTPHLDVGVQLIKYSTNSEKQANLMTPAGVRAEYGLNEMFSTAIDLGVGYTGTSYTCDVQPCPENRHSSGLMDPKFSFKGRNPLAKGTLRYGADLTLALEKHKISSSLNGNMSSGGHGFTPWAGYELLLGPGILGAKLAYELVKTDRKTRDDNAGADQTDSAGRRLSLSAFYELKMRQVTYGLALTQTLRDESRTAINGAPSNPNRDQGTETELKLYVPIQLGERIVLLPAAHLSVERYPNSNLIDGSGTYGVNLAGRFKF